MSKRKLICFLTSYVVAASSNAFAGADSPPSNVSLKDAPIVRSGAVFSGLYVGFHAGYGWGDTSFKDGGTDIRNPPYGAFACGPALTGNYCDTPFEVDSDGWLGGVQIGMNWKVDHVVFGVESEFGFLGADSDETLQRPFLDRDIASVDYRWYSLFAGRLGYEFGRTLIYVKGGLALADIEVEAADIDFDGTEYNVYEPSRINKSDVQVGWALGGGLEFALADGISLRTEYVYMDFGSDTAVSPDGDIYKFSNDIHTVRFGVNFALSSQ